MRRRTAFVVVVAVVSAVSLIAHMRETAAAPQRVITDRFGTITIYPSARATKAVLMLVAGSASSAPETADVIERLRSAGGLVYVIDAARYLNAIRNDPSCVVVGAELERLNQSLQSSSKSESFLLPVLIGIGKGADLAAVAHFHSPDRFTATFAYGVTGEELDNVCLPPGLTSSERRYVAETPHTLCDESLLVVPARDSGGGAVPCAQPGVSFQRGLDKVLAAVPDSSARNALIELPAGESQPLALFLSGDGGWAGIDKGTGVYLQQHGINVVGWSSLFYFWKTKSPDAVARDALSVLRDFEARWRPSHVLLIGYSLGADAVPLIYRRLPESAQQNVAAVIMLAPERNYDLTVHISDWIVEDSESGTPLLPELKGIPPEKILCLYGAEDDGGLCPLLDRTKYTVVALPGGHHFDGEYQDVGEQIRSFVERRLAAEGELKAPRR